MNSLNIFLWNRLDNGIVFSTIACKEFRRSSFSFFLFLEKFRSFHVAFIVKSFLPDIGGWFTELKPFLDYAPTRVYLSPLLTYLSPFIPLANTESLIGRAEIEHDIYLFLALSNRSERWDTARKEESHFLSSNPSQQLRSLFGEKSSEKTSWIIRLILIERAKCLGPKRNSFFKMFKMRLSVSSVPVLSRRVQCEFWKGRYHSEF